MSTSVAVLASIYGTWLLICLVEEVRYRRRRAARRAVFASRGAR